MRCLVCPKDELAHILMHVYGVSAVEDREVMVRAYLVSFLDQPDTGAMRLFNRCRQRYHRMEGTEVPSFHPYKTVIGSGKSMADPSSQSACNCSHE